MEVRQTAEELIESVEDAVRETLVYFQGPGQESSAHVGGCGAWEVLAHFPYWHYATAWGICSATLDGPPWRLSASADETNAACLGLLSGEGFDSLIAQLREAQARLTRAARDARDLDRTAFLMPDGREVSIRQRLETIARHWRGHLEALQQASA